MNNTAYFEMLKGTQQVVRKEEKLEQNKRRKRNSTMAADEDSESRDWWTKYFASVEAMIQVINTNF